MKIVKNCVLLLKADKSEDENDLFEVILTNAGFAVKRLKTLEFKNINLEQLSKKLNNFNNYSGIIFTTPRTVKAISGITNEHLNSEWKNKLNYAVGETTSKLALEELHLQCKGQESGNASNLAKVIINDKNNLLKSLLLPCGNLKTDTLINELNKASIPVDIITVYQTVINSTLENDFNILTKNYTEIPEYFVYFSPSGVNCTYDYIQRFNILADIQFIAIGPTTESALINKNLKVKSVAQKPTPQELLIAITK